MMDGTRASEDDSPRESLSVITISDETTISSTTGDEQTFLGRVNASTKSSIQKVPDAEPAPTNDAPTKILFLDGIRGLAAILVVLQHSHEVPTEGLRLGSVAVDAFFVLSSLLLTWLFMKKSMDLLARQAKARSWTIALLDYFQKRFFRVYPLFAVTAIALSFLSHDNQRRYYRLGKNSTYDLGKVLLFYSGYRTHVFWTLPLEIGYYIVIPGFVLITLRMRRFWWLGALPLLVWILYAGFTTFRNDHMGLAPHLHTFLAGSLGAVIFVKSDLWIKKTKFTFRWWHILFLRVFEGSAIAMLLSVSFRGLVFDWIFEDPVTNLKGFGFVSVQMTAIFVIEMLCPSCISTMFEWSVLRYWGKISFSVYLLHSFVISYPPISSQKKYFNRLVARFGLILVLATATYYLIEYPSQLLAQRISRFLAARDSPKSESGSVRFTSMDPIKLQHKTTKTFS